MEEAVLCQVRKMADMLTEERGIRRKTHKDGRKAVFETMVADSTKEMARWKGTKMHLYEQYKAGEISRENYMDRIEKDRLKTLIEKVIVYGEDAVEIVWKVENPFRDENSA